MSNDDSNSFGKQIAALFLAGSMILFLAGWTIVKSTKRCKERCSGSTHGDSVAGSDSARRGDPSVILDTEVMRATMWATFRDQVAKLEGLAQRQRLQQRMAYIQSKLPTKVFVEEYSHHNSPNMLCVPQTSVESAVGDIGMLEEGYKACAICLNEYKGGDEISWSQNCACTHHFHHSCVIEWLLTHENCPCCRQVFLFPDEKEAGGLTIPCPGEMFDSSLTSVSNLPNETALVIREFLPCSSAMNSPSPVSSDSVTNNNSRGAEQSSSSRYNNVTQHNL